MNFGKFKNIISMFIMALLLVCLFVVTDRRVVAKDSFIAGYVQVVYNTKNGIGSNEVNCLYQSTSGYIWVGTDGGLYRSSGAGFTAVNLWDTDRTDVYSINCMLQDTTGRMWIGTDNYGLFYIEQGETYHLQEEYYDGIKTILDICETDNGTIYAATANGLYLCTAGGEDENDMVMEPYMDRTVANYKFDEIEAFNDKIWGIYGSEKIYVMGNDGVEHVIDTSELVRDELRCLSLINGRMYVGTSGSDVLLFNHTRNISALHATIEGINELMPDNEGRIWACSDIGIGYFDKKGTFHQLSDCQVDNYLSDMIQDYEGNFWIASTRMGVLALNKSKFIDFNINVGMSESMVNCVYLRGQNKFIGTDDGLIIYNRKNEAVYNDLTKMLEGVSIRHIMEDSNGNMWISTHRRYGVVKVAKDGTITSITRAEGLPSYGVNITLELADGRIAVATEEGVAIVEKSEEIYSVYNAQSGMEYENVLCMYQNSEGNLLCGTDGGGLYQIYLKSGAIENYDTESGLNSNVVTSMAEGKEGLWIGTDNGLCFYNNAFRTVSNIDYSNNIYELIVKDTSVWIIGSKGVLWTTEEDLLSSQGIVSRALDKNDGLTKDINNICNCAMDKEGVLYICCNTGICTLDTKNIPYNTVAPRVKVTAIDVDGVVYELDDLADGLNVNKDVSRITIHFAVFSFTNRENISVEYFLEGFDETPIVIDGSGSMEAVYTNLDGGDYLFKLKAYNGDGKSCDEELSFKIEKEKKLLESPVARGFLLFVIFMGIVLIIYAALRVRKILLSNNREMEMLSKQHEEAVKSSSAKNDYLANMSNEIKTPINAIMAKADELLSLPDTNEQYRENIASIYETGNNILEKVDDIILLARLEAGKADVVNDKYSVTTMMYELSELMMRSIGDKNVKFFVELGDNIVDLVVGDGEKIKDILLRLLDNAVRYTKEGSITISVDCYEYADRANKNMVNFVYTVSDTGIGIQPELLETVFEVSQIADNMKNNGRYGYGLGLAIAKGYADVLHAELEVESTYGAGSSFTLSVNQTVADAKSTALNAAKVEETVTKDVASKLWLPDVTALLVDDDEVSCDVAVNVLGQFDMKVDITTSGLEAIDMVLNHNYDVVFMDLSMPIMSGVDAMKEIRELDGEAYSFMPIISMDANAIADNKQTLLEAGFTDTLIKPLDIRRVAAILKDCLPEDKIKEKPDNISDYIEASKYRDGLMELEPYIDVTDAINKIGGNIDVFNKLITAYHSQNQNAAEDLYEKLGNDMRGFKAKIHTIKTTSINIGAIRLSKDAAKLEAAISVGDKDYVKKNLEAFADNLAMLTEALQQYIAYVEATMTNEAGEQVGDEADYGLDMELLNDMQENAKVGMFELVQECVDKLKKTRLDGDDMGFVNALDEAVAEKNAEAIDDLIKTYISLKL
ncbi:MAG: response regulator [Clostridium sp.]|nr:response regulator [Clostridium sp.]MCM1398683.1 response regulator [Clostridium sp.]MCM1458686.1 response regulator [Bacteroides sp.]